MQNLKKYPQNFQLKKKKINSKNNGTVQMVIK